MDDQRLDRRQIARQKSMDDGEQPLPSAMQVPSPRSTPRPLMVALLVGMVPLVGCAPVYRLGAGPEATTPHHLPHPPSSAAASG